MNTDTTERTCPTCKQPWAKQCAACGADVESSQGDKEICGTCEFDDVKITHELLVKAFTAAKAAAWEHHDVDDNGTCNFDSPVLVIPRIRQSIVMDAATEAGCSMYVSTWLGKRTFFLDPNLQGQADRRSSMAQAACNALKRFGLPAYMYCQMD